MSISDQIKVQRETRRYIADKLVDNEPGYSPWDLDATNPDVRITLVWLQQKIRGVLPHPRTKPQVKQLVTNRDDIEEKYEKAMSGWSSYAWKDGEYIDDIQSYFDDVIKRGSKT